MLRLSKTYYFEILPVHFKPLYLEACSSYLTRLAVANVITNLIELKNITEVAGFAKAIKGHSDFPLDDWGALPSALGSDSQSLLQTTFYHLLRKFAHSSGGRRVNQFLEGSLAASLRFCPKCLGEGESYYSLTWRFKALVGCSKHKCYLLEKCTYCHHYIDLVTTPFSFGICPNCTQLLHSCTTLPVKEAEQAELDYTQQELEFLLLPHSCEEQAYENLAKIGKKLRQVRKEQHLSISQWAARLKQEPKEILFIEDGRLENGVASLATYLAYTKYTNLSFSQLFC